MLQDSAISEREEVKKSDNNTTKLKEKQTREIVISENF